MKLFALLIVFVILDICLCFNGYGTSRIVKHLNSENINIRSNSNNNEIITKNNHKILIKKLLVPILLGLSLQKPMISASFAVETSTLPTENKVILTASDVLSADVKPKVDLLNDVLFTIKLFPTIVEQNDYAQIRLSFRSGPTTELRKTCRKLIPFLEEPRRGKFDKAYQDMIEELDYLDVLCLRRAQGEGIPEKGKPDDVMLNQIAKLTTKFESMINIVSN